jgi:hypothetical protein
MAAKPKDVTKMTPRQLAEELVRLTKENQCVFDREAELKSQLKSGATSNFQETFPGIGQVNVSAPKKGKFKGTVPELVTETFLALKEDRRAKLIEQGLVANVDQYGGDYYGAVTVKVF